MAHTIQAFTCPHCAAVHIGMFRNGKMFAEAIPVEIEGFAKSLAEKIAESRERQAAPSPASH
jgi:glutaredoxin